MLSFVLRHKYSLINLALWLVFGWLVYLAGRWVLPFVMPLVFGLLIAILIEPIVKLLTRMKLPRWLATVVTLLALFGGGATLFLLLAAKMTIELVDFATRVPAMVTGLINSWHDLFTRAIAFYGSLSPTMSAQVQSYLGDLGKTLTTIAKSFANSMVDRIQAIPSLITIFLLGLLISFFISKDFLIWQRRILSLINPNIRKKSDVVLDDLGKATFGYVRAQAILIFITFLEVLVGLLILHVKYAFTLSIIAALMDLVPLVGTGALFVPWAVYMLATGDTRLGIGLFIIFGVGVLMRQILEPKILAESIGIDPLITLVTIYAGYQAIGFLGVILAPFVIITVTSMLKVKAFDFLIDDDHDEPPHPPNPPQTT